ncbi:MAG TPA: antitoxin family protein [Pirellulaceae bacterium]|jgi:predicted DNA-binding antitoxin AbrB/MazE fold protein
MTITIDATYEDGVLKPAEPLPFAEGTRVRVTIEKLIFPDGSLVDIGEPPVGP